MKNTKKWAVLSLSLVMAMTIMPSMSNISNIENHGTVYAASDDIKIKFVTDYGVDYIDKNSVKVSKGSKLQKAIDKADIKFKNGYELDRYVTSDDEKIDKSDKLNSNKTIKIISKKKSGDLEILSIDIYKNYTVVKVASRDTVVYLEQKDNYKKEKDADKPLKNGNFQVVFSGDFTDKSVRENTKIWAKKGNKETKEIKLDSSNKVITVHDENYNNIKDDDYIEIYPRKVELVDDKSKVKGIKETEEKIYVFYNGYQIGEGKADKEGQFEIKLTDSLAKKDTEESLKFYILKEKEEEKAPVQKSTMAVIRGLAGEKIITGVDAPSETELKVKDAKNEIIGTAKSNSAGSFVIQLNRELKAGEIITVSAERKEISYIVPDTLSGTVKMEKSGKILTPPEKIYKANYTDIKGHWGQKAIDFVTTIGLFNGVGDNKFAPDLKTDKAMFTTLLNRLAKQPSATKTTPIKDAESNYYYYPAAQWALEKNIVILNNGKFMGNDEVTRAEVAKMLSKFVDVMGLEFNTVNTQLKDIENLDQETKSAIEKVVKLGIMKGRADGNFDPKATITRAEAAQILMNFIELAK